MNLKIINYQGGAYRPGTHRIHLPDDASIISTHHTNWRIQAIKNAQSPTKQNMHYSSVVSLSKDDFVKIKAHLMKSIEEAKVVIRDSESEQI